MNDHVPEIGYEVYENLPESTKELLLNPTAKTLGEALDGIVSLFCTPLIKIGIAQKTSIKRFANEVMDETNKISPEQRDKSKLNLVAKALESARYQLDEDDIRQMYVKLIGSTINKQKSSFVSPYMASVISQLGTEEAKLIQLVSKQQNQKLLLGQGWIVETNRRYDQTATKILIMSNDGIPHINLESSMNILESLGVINVEANRKLTAEQYQENYSKIKSAIQKTKPELKGNERFECRLGYIEFTDFGNEFWKCIS